MPANFLRLIAVSAALLHLADAALTSLAHCHGPGLCAQIESQQSAVHTHPGGKCGHAHTHEPATTLPATAEPIAPGGHQHDCAACRHLCQPLATVPLTLDQDNGDLFFAAVIAPPAATAPARPHRYRSRAPPRLAA